MFEDGENTFPVYYKHSHFGNVRYIRSDIAELTWQDVKLLDELMDTVLKEHKDTPLYEVFYSEVLRRFNEQKV